MLGRTFYEIYKQDFHGLHAFRSSRPVVDTTTPRVPTLTDALTTDADIIATVRIGHNVWQKGLGFQTPSFYTPGRPLTTHPRVGHRRLGFGGHKQIHERFVIINHWDTGVVNNQGRDAFWVACRIGRALIDLTVILLAQSATRDMHTTFMLTSRQFPGDASMVFPQPDTPTRHASRLPSFGGEGCAHC